MNDARLRHRFQTKAMENTERYLFQIRYFTVLNLSLILKLIHCRYKSILPDPIILNIHCVIIDLFAYIL